MPTLEDALQLALTVHRGQTDRTGRPYILHVLRVLANLDVSVSDSARFVAILHDVVEDGDGDPTLDDLRRLGYPEDVLAAVDALTRRDEEAWDDYLARVETVPLAVTVKLADLRDNMTIQRLPTVTANDLDRLDRYVRAWHRLTGTAVSHNRT